jgi:hypothetical protein
MELVEEHFDDWGLTGCRTRRGPFRAQGPVDRRDRGASATSQGTVKAQTNAIYRKAGVSGRPQLLSLFVDELMDASADHVRRYGREGVSGSSIA